MVGERKDPNYGQELAFQSKHRTTNKTSRNGHQAEWQNLKIITLLGTQEQSRLRPKHLVIPIISVPGFKNWNQLHISVYTTTTKPNAIYPTTGEASSILSRKEDNCYISIVGINSNAPQVAPRTTRGYPTSIAISLTQFFFQCSIPGTCFPQKGRSEGDAGEK